MSSVGLGEDKGTLVPQTLKVDMPNMQFKLKKHSTIDKRTKKGKRKLSSKH